MIKDENFVSVMLYLIGCAIHDEKPEEKYLLEIDLERLYKISKYHSLSAMICMALEKTNTFKNSEPEVQKMWKDSKNKAIRKNILLDTERNLIFSEMRKQNIWYMPLKGSVLKNYYPREGMREMGDNDILFDYRYQKNVREIFKERGFNLHFDARENHDVFRKNPVYKYEMHMSLFPENIYPDLAEYYKNIDEKLLAVSEYEKRLSDEDFYIYITTHAYKHFSNSGNGLRSLIDQYIMYRQFGDKLNREYVDKQLCELNIADFEKVYNSLSQKLFSRAELIDMNDLSESETEILSFCFSSGTYGTIENNIKKNLKNQNKFIYFLKRILKTFPSRKQFKNTNKFLYYFPIAIPFYWIIKLTRKFIVQRKKIKKEIEIVSKEEKHR